MELKLNNITSPQNLLILDDVPNIISIEEDSTDTYTTITLQFRGNPQAGVSEDNQWFISVGGDSVTNTITPQNATAKRFYVASDHASTAASVAAALANSSTIISGFKIWSSGPYVYLKARKSGVYGALTSTNIPSTYLAITTQGGTTTSTLAGGKVKIDVSSAGEYQMSLVKNYYKDNIFFDASAAIASLTEYDSHTALSFKVTGISTRKVVSDIGTLSATVLKGYKTKWSENYLFSDKNQLILPDYQGFVSKDSIDVSVWATGTTTPVTTKVYDSVGTVIETINATKTTVYGINHLELGYTLDAEADKVTVTVGDTTRTFRVIRPTTYAEDVTRIEWYNEYGGLSFNDFTAHQEIEISDEITTATKHRFDYYTAPAFYSTSVVSNNSTKAYQVTSHLVSKDELHVFDSLFAAKRIWIKDDDGRHYIIPHNYQVNETDSQNDVYEVTMQFMFANPFE
jgi:hypothetical protein